MYIQMNLNIKNLKTCSRKEISVPVFNVGTHKALCFLQYTVVTTASYMHVNYHLLKLFCSHKKVLK